MALSICNSKTNQLGRELVEHGNGLFPVACYHDNLIKADVPWHWHDEWEFIIVSKGTAIISIENAKYTVKCGEGFFINAGILHAAKPADDSVCLFHSIVFHPRLVGGSIDSIFWHSYVNPILTNPSMKYIYLDLTENWHTESINAVESAWQNCVSEPFGYELKVRAFLSELIANLTNYRPILNTKPSEKVIRDNERIKIMLQYIQEHYDEPITVSELASKAMISESECLRCFRNTIGTPPIQYLKQFRIQKASELLISTSYKISKVSELCGFQDVSYFVKTFREIKGKTPSEYRKDVNI
ncbi:MAG: helix-turn-helix domain-containing protein [Proteocatella sp.]